MTAVEPIETRLPLPLLRQGKVREVYQVDPERLLLVASDRISAFDVIMNERIPHKGAVLTQISAYWFRRFADVSPNHFVTADVGEVVVEVPALAGHEEALRGRAMLCRRTTPVLFECVVRGYLAGSAWAEYSNSGTLAGESLRPGLENSSRLDQPIFSPATKADVGHDENVTYAYVVKHLGEALANELRQRSLQVYQTAREHAAERGMIIADTKFEFGHTDDGELLLIDEVLTPDSSRFWPADRYAPGRSQPSFDKQPLRDYLATLRDRGEWNGDAPPPPLSADVVEATSKRYLEAYRLMTGHDLFDVA